jgi:hypothetical protein
MLHPLGSLFKNPRNLEWEENDVRYFVQDFLRSHMKTEAVYCDRVKEGTVFIRTGSAALQQAVRLIEHDLKQTVQDKTGYLLTRVKVSR